MGQNSNLSFLLLNKYLLFFPSINFSVFNLGDPSMTFNDFFVVFNKLRFVSVGKNFLFLQSCDSLLHLYSLLYEMLDFGDPRLMSMALNHSNLLTTPSYFPLEGLNSGSLFTSLPMDFFSLVKFSMQSKNLFANVFDNFSPLKSLLGLNDVDVALDSDNLMLQNIPLL